MQDDDEIIKKIQEASERYQPAYDEASWADMQRQLDEHLPQKKNKRRLIFLILFALIPLVGLYIAFEFKNTGTVQSPASSVSTAPASPTLKVPEVNRLKQPASEDQENRIQITPNSNSNRNSRQQGVIKITGTGNSYLQNPSLSRHIPLVTNQNNKTGVTIAGNAPGYSSPDKTPGEIGTVDSTIGVAANTTTPDFLNTDKTDSFHEDKQTKVTGRNNKGDTAKIILTARELKKDRNRFKQYWLLGAGIGPGINAVKLDNTGKITLQYGMQLGYAISPRLTLRTGFFVSKKIYDVGANDYHDQGNYYNNYLQSVDADCNVYEFPLIVSYNFASKKNGRWFAAGGLSSYLMKRESYNYLYKYPGGITYTKNYTVTNKNQHYFSIIDFSAGYERTLSKNVSISAEPYLKLPVTGIGVGKIKLNSGGVLFSINVKPFR